MTNSQIIFSDDVYAALQDRAKIWQRLDECLQQVQKFEGMNAITKGAPAELLLASPTTSTDVPQVIHETLTEAEKQSAEIAIYDQAVITKQNELTAAKNARQTRIILAVIGIIILIMLIGSMLSR